MQLQAVLHVPLSNYAFAVNQTSLVIRLRTARDDIQQCSLYYGDRVCEKDPIDVTELKMKKIASDQLFDYYEAEIKDDYTRVCYYFKLEDGKEYIFYSGYGFSQEMKCSRTQYFQFPYIRREDIPGIPAWAKEMVMYHIFPDSFATEKNRIAEKECCIKKEGKVYKTHQGGTIKGMIESLDYIARLGVNCVYLNPIFAAESYHKYDTVDYFRIDPCFGTLEEFKELVKRLHERGIRIILDGVFNHCGAGFFAFQDVLENGENSPYRDWFYQMEFPVHFGQPLNYEAFAYVKEMPKLNTGNQEVVEYFKKVGTWWIKETDIDGWRLDVANEINHDFWREFRKAVRSVKKDAILIGEIWEDSEIWLMGDQFDSTMNYTFSYICREFFAEHTISLKEFDEKMNRMLLRYPHPVSVVQMNFLDTHDVPRFLSYCKNGMEDLKQAVFFMMMCVGIPSVFYGDEQLIEGMTEPEYRKPMPWNCRNLQMETFFEKWIQIRRRFPALQEGRYETALLKEEKGIYGFWRYTEEQRVLVLMNLSKQEQMVELPEADVIMEDSDRRKEESGGNVQWKEDPVYIDVENGVELRQKEVAVLPGTGKVILKTESVFADINHISFDERT